MLDGYSIALPTPTASSSSFPPAAARARFDYSKSTAHVKRIDFPIKPHLLKYLQVHLQLARINEDPLRVADYVLSRTGRWGLALTQLLRKPPKSARHETSTKDCTAVLGVDLRNFPYPYYHLLQSKLPSYSVFQFNDFVDELFHAELYWWVDQHVRRRASIKDAIQSYLALYEVTEEEKSYESLRKSVQRNSRPQPPKKKQGKTNDFSMNMSQKTGGMSQKKSGLSPKVGIMSQRDMFSAVRQELMKLPLPLFETQFFYAGR